MAYQYKPVQTSKTINFAAKMDNRSNSEVLDINTDNTGFVFTNLQNADLFNTKALSVRPGVNNVCGGIRNLKFRSSPLVDIFSGVGNANSQLSYFQIYRMDEGPNIAHAGFIFIPTKATILKSGAFIFNDAETPASLNALGAEANYEIDARCYVYAMDQTPVPLSGIGYMSGIANGNSTLYNIALSGTFNQNTLPRFESVAGPYPSGTLPVGIGESRISFNSYVNGVSADTTFNMNFNTPIPLSGTRAYFGMLTYALTSGKQLRTIQMKILQNSGIDFSVNSSFGQTSSFPTYSTKNTIPSLNTKVWPIMNLSSYDSCDFLSPEIVTATQAVNIPFTSGIATDGVTQSLGNPSLPLVQTSTFGQTFTNLSSGITYYGAYFYAAPQNLSNNYTFKNSDNSALTGMKSVGIITDLSLVVSQTGNIGSGNYNVSSKTSVASNSGFYVFDFSKPNNNAGVVDYTNSNLNFRLNKIYTAFSTPATLTQTGTYLLNYKLYDLANGNYLDYAQSITGVKQYVSPIGIGINTLNNASGAFVYDYSGVQVYQQLATGIFSNSPEFVLDCGLITVPSGNGITSVYDYRVGSNRVQRIISTIKDQVQYSTLNNCNYTTIFSGANIGNNFKWSHATYQNLLLSHQYAQISGLCWDQIYSNPSGFNSMQIHGQRPAFSATVVSGIQSVYSGIQYGISGTYSVKVLLATQMGTGGVRASNYQTVQLSGNTNYIRIAGPSGVTSPWFQNSIFSPSGYPIESQYALDIPPQSTYVFVTQPSGNIFYLAGLVNGPDPLNPGYSLMNNPLPNKNSFNISGVPTILANPTINGISGVAGINLTGIYIGDVSAVSLTQQVPNVILFDQNYLNDQVETPKFKKLLVFKDYVLGIGDPNFPSRLWFSQQFFPQIWGTDGVYAGYQDIDADNGSPITGFGVFKDYLLVFKYNSTYRLTYTGDPSVPFSVYQMSSTIGNLGFFTPVSTDYGVFGLSQFGPFMATFAGVDTIGDEILPYFQTLDAPHLTFSTAVHDRARQQIYWSIVDDSNNSSSNLGLTYSYVEKAWTVRQNGLWNSAGTIGDDSNFNLLYIGDPIGQLQQISTAVSSDTIFSDGQGLKVTTPIVFSATTPWLSMGDSQHLKQLRSLRLNCETASEQIKIDVYYDQNDSVIQYSRILDMSVPVLNRSISLAGTCRTVKFVFTTVNGSAPVKLKSLQLSYQDLGLRSNL